MFAPSRCIKEHPAILRSPSSSTVAWRDIAASVCFATWGLYVLPASVAAEPVLRVAASAVELPVAVECPAAVDAACTWQLTLDGSAMSVPVQFGAAPSADGSPAAGRQRLMAVLPAGGEASVSRRFQLAPASAAWPAHFTFRDVAPESLQLCEGESPVFVYNHGVITRQDIPQQEHRRSRSCYIHPLYGLSGEVLTDDFPADHYHHHGIFWTWPHVLVDGQAHDLWAGSTIAQKFHRYLARETGPVSAVLAVENGWYVGEELVMVERIWVRVFRAAAGARAMDMELYFTPVKPLSLQGAEGKSYGGLTVRFAPGAREETLITVPSGPAADDLPDTRLTWADFTSRFGQREHRSGAAILVSPRHPDYPPAWLTRYYGAMCVGFPGVEARAFEAGQPFRLDYRLWIHGQAAEFGRLQEVYTGYLQATDTQLE